MAYNPWSAPQPTYTAPKPYTSYPGSQPAKPYTSYAGSSAAVAPTSGGGSAPKVTDPKAKENQVSAPSEPSVSDYENQVRNDINSGYDSYFSQLDSILNNDLPTQRAAQEGIVTSQGTVAKNTLGAQKEQGLVDLGAQTTKNNENQVKSLTDLAENIRNQFKAGNIFLGARGAGDSSAANQYSYAIAKMGTKSRGDVLGKTRDIQNQIDDRTTKLKTVYDTELNNISEGVNQKMLEVANWFSQAQTQLKQAKAQGSLQKGQDLANLSKSLLQTATQQMLATQQEAANRRLMLDQWQLNNQSQIQTAAKAVAEPANYQAPNVTAQTINGAPTVDQSGNMTGPTYGGGFSWDDLKKQLGIQ